MILYRTYRFRMRPNKRQEQALVRMGGARRFAYNWALARRRAYYAEHHRLLPINQLMTDLTALKNAPKTAWLKEVSAKALQQAVRDLDAAFGRFFRGTGRFPKFKRRKSGQLTFRITQNIRVKDGKVYVAKIGWIRIVQSQPIEDTTKSATFKRDPTGKWFVAIVSRFEIPDVPLPAPNPDRVIGVDVGLRNLVALSDGTRCERPRFLANDEQQLKRAQRILTRRKKGSRRRMKARTGLARIHRRIADRRKDFLHKLTTDLVMKHDAICMERLNVEAMARTTLGKSIRDAGLGEIRRQVEYKSNWNRKPFVLVDRFFPSSKRCSKCGAVNRSLSLSERTWRCPCGAIHDRDLNAALNLRLEGLRLLAVGHTDNSTLAETASD